MNTGCLEIHPGPPLRGRFVPPGDKSVTHRAYLLGLMSAAGGEIENPNPGADCEATISCAERLGVAVTRARDRTQLAAHGPLAEPDRVLECGNSGTTLRLLAGVLAARPFLSILSGDDSLRARPVARVIDPLRRMGACLSAREGDRLPPLVIRGAPLHGIHHDVPVASAQVASCVLFAGLQAKGETVVALPGPARDHTERMLGHLGVPIEVEPLPGGGRRVTVAGPRPIPRVRVPIPGDLSAAAFFFAAAAAMPGASVTALGVLLNPTRTGFLDILERMGAKVERDNLRVESGEPVGDVTVIGPDRLQGFDIPAEWVGRTIDEVPAWAVAAARASGCSRLVGASELRVKESDRIATLASNLAAVGIKVRERPDGIEIEGGSPAGGIVRAAHDHRIAMAFAVLGTSACGPITVEEADGIDSSFPGFARTLAALGGEVRSRTGQRTGG